MKKTIGMYLSGLALGFVLGVSALAVYAQAPAAPPAAVASGPQNLDDTDKLLIEIVSVRAQLANCQADQLDSMKSFNATRAEVIKRIESKHPGYTLDAAGKLVEKKK